VPVRYELQLPERRPLEPFVSHSGPYIAGDRLVTPKGEEWRVVGVEADRDPARLVCDRLSAERSQDRGLPRPQA
jgi:hypothetical protein